MKAILTIEDDRVMANTCWTKANGNPGEPTADVASDFAGSSTLAPAPLKTAVLSISREPVAALVASAPWPDEAEQFQLNLRRNTISRIPQRLSELRRLLQNLIKCEPAARPSRLLDLYRAVQSLTSLTGAAGLSLIARMSSVIETLLDELQKRRESVNPSTLRTLAQAVDCLAKLCEPASRSEDELIAPPLILVLDDDSISRETVCAALDQVQLRAVTLDDSTRALKLLEKSHFDLVFLDVDMAGLNGLEVCKRLRSLPANKTTPVVFLTRPNNFGMHARSTLSGETDFIVKPVVLIELALKALIHLFRGRLAASPPLAALGTGGKQATQRVIPPRTLSAPHPFPSEPAASPTRLSSRQTGDGSGLHR